MKLVTCVQVAEATAKQIETAAAAYKPCSVRAAILYFVLNDLAGVDPMYQFSLDAYNDLFLISIQKSAKSDKLEERIKSLNDYHTYAVYKYTSRCVLHPLGRVREGRPDLRWGIACVWSFFVFFFFSSVFFSFSPLLL